jgi:hypothetical protein
MTPQEYAKLSPAQKTAMVTDPKRAPAPKGPAGLAAMGGANAGKFLDTNSPNGQMYTAQGSPAGQIGIRMPQYDKVLANIAGKEYYGDWLRQMGRKSCELTDQGGRLVKMDLAPTDVHIDSLLPNFNGGYHLAEGAADLAAPVIVTDKNSNKYNVWNQKDTFQRVASRGGAPGAQVAEVNPNPNFSTYSCLEYALAAFVTVEVQANADVPLQPLAAGTRRVLTALKLEREIRVATALRLAGNWNSNMLQALTSGTKWSGGGANDPLANIHQMIENSAMSVDRLLWSEVTLHEFLRTSKIQGYMQYKDSINPMPIESVISEKFGLPPITTIKMKYNVPSALISGVGTYRSTTYPYVWGGDVVGIHEPPQMPPMSQDDVATAVTFRWNGANAAVRDGEYSAGFLVRTYWDQRRGGRGGMVIVVVHSDAEVITSNLVGGLITGAVQ